MVPAALSGELGLRFAPEDVALTQGAFGAIALAFTLVMDAGAEVVIPVPGWFCYAPMLRAANLVPVKAALDPASFDLDLAAIEAAITPRTRMVVVNTPAQSDRADLPARRAAGAGRPARGGVEADRRADLAALRRALPAHPLRRQRLHQPGGGLSLDADRL